MKKITSLSLACCFALCTMANAQDARMTPGMPAKIKGISAKQTDGPGGSTFEGAKCESATCSDDVCSDGECPVLAKAMEALPKMVFLVGEEETCCHMTATRMAHENHSKIKYVVGTKKFYESEDAFKSLVKQTELYVKRFIKPKVCDESGATTLAGETCECPKAASHLTESVATATENIKLAYRVGEEQFEKLHDARRHAKKTHQKGKFLVGDEEFGNELEARLAVAHKKYRSAVMAVQSVKAQTAKTQATPKGETQSEVAANDT